MSGNRHEVQSKHCVQAWTVNKPVWQRIVVFAIRSIEVAKLDECPPQKVKLLLHEVSADEDHSSYLVVFASTFGYELAKVS
jgi:hypothetical protein